MPINKPQIKIPTAVNVILRIALIVGGVEALIMLCFNLTGTNPLGPLAALLDAFSLVILGSPLLYVFVVRPYILDREKEHSIVEFLAHHDELTALCNRRMLDEHLKRCIPALARQGAFGALIYFDLDRFKPINDEYGHDMGDRVLTELGSRLSESLRGEEIAARVGGDEFVLLVVNAGNDRLGAQRQADQFAQRIRQLVQEPMTLQGLILQVGCSIGVHILGPSSQNALLAMKAADDAMYQAKQTGTGSIVFSDALQKPTYDLVSIGVMEIDREHQQIDQLLGALFEQQGDRVAAMQGLLAAVEQHFYNEVKISHRLGLNMTPEHIVEHAHLLQRLRTLNPAEDQLMLREQLLSIGKLLEEHIMLFDRSLSLNSSAKPEQASHLAGS